MEPLFLAQLLGVYFLIVGSIVMLRQKAVMPAISDILSNRPVLYILSLVELAAGLAIVLAYPTVSLNWMGIISLVGWMMAIEGILYLALPARKIQHFVRSFNTQSWYIAGGVLAVVLGAYLAGIGFGLV